MLIYRLHTRSILVICTSLLLSAIVCLNFSQTLEFSRFLPAYVYRNHVPQSKNTSLTEQGLYTGTGHHDNNIDSRITRGSPSPDGYHGNGIDSITTRDAPSTSGSHGSGSDSKSRRSQEISTISDVMFTIKTTESFFKDRLKILMKTWMTLVPSKIHIITDTDRAKYSNIIHNKGHTLKVSNCGTTHGTLDLCCKMGYELDAMVKNIKRYRWFCRCDDDTYINPHGLLLVLNRHNWTTPTIIGRTHALLKTWIPKSVPNPGVFPMGAAVCMSRALLMKLTPHVQGGKYAKFCHKSLGADDVGLAVVAFIHAGIRTIDTHTMYSHFNVKEERKDLLKKPLNNIAAIPARYDGRNVTNVGLEAISPAFSKEEDPSRFYSLHCHLHPTVDYCRSLYPNATTSQ